MKTILITGASGRVGKTLVAGLKNLEFNLKLLDIEAQATENSSIKIHEINILDFDALLEVSRNVDCIVHLAGIPDDDSWDNLLQTNISATYHVFEAARIHKIPKVIFASSNRVISFYPKDKKVDINSPPRPDGLYGVSKVAGEALARLYADKYGIDVICVRLGSFEEKPKNLRHLSTWISPRDLVQLFYQCIVAPCYSFMIIYGVSANTRNHWDNTGAELIGYVPQDNAEIYANSIKEDTEDPLTQKFHGGFFCLNGFVGDVKRIT